MIRNCPFPADNLIDPCGGWGRGICIKSTGTCHCFTANGWTGPACGECLFGWRKTLGPARCNPIFTAISEPDNIVIVPPRPKNDTNVTETVEDVPPPPEEPWDPTAVIVIGVILAIALCYGGFIWLRKQRKKKKRRRRRKHNEQVGNEWVVDEGMFYGDGAEDDDGDVGETTSLVNYTNPMRAK